MKLSDLEQKLETYEQNKRWTKRFVATDQIELLKAFIQGLKTTSQVNIAEDIKYSHFMEFCKAKKKEPFFSDEYLNSGRKSAQLFQAWRYEEVAQSMEEHNNRQWTHKLPGALLTVIFGFFDKRELKAVAETCRGFHRIVSHNGYQLFQKAPYTAVDYTRLLKEPSPGRANILEGHTASVSIVITAPNGDIVSGSQDNTIRIWNAKTGECKKVLKGHTDWISSLAIIPNEDIVSGSADTTIRIVSGSADHTIRIWDASTGKCKVLEGHTDGISCLAIAPNRNIVSGSQDGTIRIWDQTTGECKLLEGHRKWIHSLVFDLNGDIVSSSRDKTIRIWDAKTGECKHVLKGHRNWVGSLVIAPTMNIVSGSDDCTIRIWNAQKGGCERVLEGHKDWIFSLIIAFTGDIVSSSADKTIRIWDASTGECKVLEGHTGWVRYLAIAPNGDIVSASDDRTIRIWDAKTGECKQVLRGYLSSITFLAISPNGDVISSSNNGTIRIRHFAYLKKSETQVQALENSSEDVTSVVPRYMLN